MENKKNIRFILKNFKLIKDLYYFNYANYCKVPKNVLRETNKTNSTFSYGSIIDKKAKIYQDTVREHLSSVFGGNKEKWFFLGPVSSVISNIGLQLIRDIKDEKKRVPIVSTYKMNFPSLIMPFLAFERMNLCKFEFLDYPEKGIDKRWCEENIKSDLFIISLVDFFNGFIHDLNLIHSYCQQKGIRLIVDFSQFPFWGHLDVGNFKNTVFISVLHKWLMGFPGFSISYMDIDSKPLFHGWKNMSNIFDYTDSFVNESYEISNVNITPFTTFEGAFKLTNLIGIEKVNKYIKDSKEYLNENLSYIEKEYQEFKIIKSDEKFKDLTSSIISVTLEEESISLFKYLKSNNIICSFFPNNYIRFSTSFITYKEEIDTLVNAIKEWIRNKNYQ